MRLLVVSLLLLLAACTKQAHHDEPSELLRQQVITAVHGEARRQGVDPDRMAPTRRRKLDHLTGLLISHAQGDIVAINAIEAESMPHATLRRWSADLIGVLTSRSDTPLEPMHAALLAKPDWTIDEALLVRLLLRLQYHQHKLDGPANWDGPWR